MSHDIHICEATSLFNAVVPLLEKLVWPFFLWFILRNQDVHRHIETLISTYRISKVKTLGIELTFFPKESVKPLPPAEVEKEITPRYRKK
jgi:hypothetical protein